jgi:hypothetical protein
MEIHGASAAKRETAAAGGPAANAEGRPAAKLPRGIGPLPRERAFYMRRSVWRRF